MDMLENTKILSSNNEANTTQKRSRNHQAKLNNTINSSNVKAHIKDINSSVLLTVLRSKSLLVQSNQ